MRKPFDGTYPISRPFIKNDPAMPKNLWDPIYGPTHRGIDYALPSGTILKAAITGQVTLASFSPDGAGNTVVIRNGNLYVKYFHLSEISVRLNQAVSEGDVIGKSGNTGNSVGPHLHFQVEQPFGNAIDPQPLLDQGGSMDKITKEQEKLCAIGRTGSEPGVDYDYRFTGLPLTQDNLDKMLQFWMNQPGPPTDYVPVGELFIKKT